ncbi:DsbA family oxidoreductase [Spirillospora sp. CA-294931]|uniref:DsbA family oxidoreductase n=1 Tax=Spirillospora sp. CA-294931 TaxID=3240042 RepID=UPI003D8D7E2C
MTTIEVPPHTIVVYADLACPWAHLAVHRLHETRARLGLEGAVTLDVHAFALELIDDKPAPKLVLDAEIPVVGALAPDAGWQVWQAPAHEWPVSVLLALEAVEAAKRQGPAASENLDRALRRALFAESRTISMRHVILDVARNCDGVDAEALDAALLTGAARAAIQRDLVNSRGDAVQGSPHLFLPDGTDVHNPGIRLRWEGKPGAGFPVIERDDPAIYDDLLTRAAAPPS